MSAQSPTAGCAVVRLKGVPPKATAEEVVAFFSGFAVDARSVHLRFKERRGAGEALVLFPSLSEAQRACTLDKEFFSPRFGQRYVRVMLADELTPADLHTLAGATLQVPAQTLARPAPLVATLPAMDVVKLRGLPIRATSTDVDDFFSGYKIRPGGVHVQPYSDNRHSKVAYVEFASAQEADRAMEKDHQRFGDAFGERYCLLQKVRRAEMEADLARFAAYPNGSSGPARSSRSAGASGASSFDALTMQQTASSGAFGMPPMGPFGGFMMPGPMSSGAWAPPAAPGMMPGMAQFALPPHLHPPGMGIVPGMAPVIAQAAASGGGGVPGVPAVAAAALAARYLVQDLTTGQMVYLDTSFRVFPCVAPPTQPTAMPANRNGSTLNPFSPSLCDTNGGARGGMAPGTVAAAAAAAAAVATTTATDGAAAADGVAKSDEQADAEGGGSDVDGSNGRGNSGSGGGSNNEDRDVGTGSDVGNGSGSRRGCSAAPRRVGGADPSNDAQHRGGNANGGVTSELRDGLAGQKRPSLAAGVLPGGPDAQKRQAHEAAAVNVAKAPVAFAAAHEPHADSL